MTFKVHYLDYDFHFEISFENSLFPVSYQVLKRQICSYFDLCDLSLDSNFVILCQSKTLNSNQQWQLRKEFSFENTYNVQLKKLHSLPRKGVSCQHADFKFKIDKFQDWQDLKKQFFSQIAKFGYSVSNLMFEYYDDDLEDWFLLDESVKFHCQSIRTKALPITKVSVACQTEDDLNERSKHSVSSQASLDEANSNEATSDKKAKLKETCECETKKWVHFKNNPFQQEALRFQQEFKKMTEDNKKLVARVELLKQGSGEVTRLVNDEVAKSDLIDTLQQELEETKRKQQTIMDSYKKTSKDFREIVYLLTGYRFDALKNRVYKLSHMLSSSENCFMFTMDSEGAVNMLETPFSVKFERLMKKYLLENDSFPAFLASVTMKLFEEFSLQSQSNFEI